MSDNLKETFKEMSDLNRKHYEWLSRKVEELRSGNFAQIDHALMLCDTLLNEIKNLNEYIAWRTEQLAENNLIKSLWDYVTIQRDLIYAILDEIKEEEPLSNKINKLMKEVEALKPMKEIWDKHIKIRAAEIEKEKEEVRKRTAQAKERWNHQQHIK